MLVAVGQIDIMIVKQDTIKYSRYTIIGLILISMLYVLGIWLDEYHGQLNLISSVSKLRQDIYSDAYRFQERLQEHERQLQERVDIDRRMRELQQNQAQRRDSDKPVTRPLWIAEPVPAAPPPPPPQVEDTNIPSKIQLLGVLELELSETTSWHTLIKMMVTVLVTFFGIKLINFLFRRWEKPVAV